MSANLTAVTAPVVTAGPAQIVPPLAAAVIIFTGFTFGAMWAMHGRRRDLVAGGVFFTISGTLLVHGIVTGGPRWDTWKREVQEVAARHWDLTWHDELTPSPAGSTWTATADVAGHERVCTVQRKADGTLDVRCDGTEPPLRPAQSGT